jgi:hypothetical protein
MDELSKSIVKSAKNLIVEWEAEGTSDALRMVRALKAYHPELRESKQKKATRISEVFMRLSQATKETE